MLDKYLNAARDIAEHAVLLPDSIRFSLKRTRREWTDESTSRLREFCGKHVAGEGRLQVQPYLAAAVRYRDALLSEAPTLDEIAAKEKLNANYFGILWSAGAATKFETAFNFAHAEKPATEWKRRVSI